METTGGVIAAPCGILCEYEYGGAAHARPEHVSDLLVDDSVGVIHNCTFGGGLTCGPGALAVPENAYLEM